MNAGTTIYAADLFCGGGGFTTGLFQAAEDLGYGIDIVVVNHNKNAIATITQNHRNLVAYCESLANVNPRLAVKSGKLDVLLASPECTHFSTARGGKPMNDQSRSSAWCVLRWLTELDVANVVLENVKEFVNWGPLHPCTCGEEAKALAEDPDTDCSKLKHLPGFQCYRPIQKKKGLYFRNFIRNLRTLGYTVEWRVLNAADYGAATSRERLFILARKGERKRIHWPEPSHERPAPKGRESQLNLGVTLVRAPWRPAREIINWDVKGHSIYLPREEARKLRIIRPLADNTLARIFAGVQKFCGIPFLLGQQSEAAPRSVNSPAPTVAGAGAISLLEPLLVILRNHADAQRLDEPIPALCASGNHVGLAQPFMVVNRAHGSGYGGSSHSVQEPIRTLTTGENMALVDPFLVTVNHAGGDRIGDLDAPLPTLLAKGNQALAQAFLVNMKGRSDASDIDRPAPTITAHARHLFVAEPFVVGAGGPVGSGRPQSITEPLGTLLGENHRALIDPFIVRYHGTDQQPHDLQDPLPVVTTRDRLALVHPELVRAGQVNGAVIGYLDILFRMLLVEELAAAMSFPKTYSFSGTREHQVRQVGNAVDVRQAKALCTSVLSSFLGKRAKRGSA